MKVETDIRAIITSGHNNQPRTNIQGQYRNHHVIISYSVTIILIKPALSNHLSYVILFQCSLGRSHSAVFTVCYDNVFLHPIFYQLIYHNISFSKETIYIKQIKSKTDLVLHITTLLSKKKHQQRPKEHSTIDTCIPLYIRS